MSQVQRKPSRRGFVLGAAVAGAAVTAVATLPRVVTPELPAAPTSPGAPEAGGGYRVSEHVKRYYRTTQV